MGYLCVNFSLPIGLSVLELGPMYATDRQTSDAHYRLMHPAIGAGIINADLVLRPDMLVGKQITKADRSSDKKRSVGLHSGILSGGILSGDILSGCILSSIFP